MLPLHLTTPEHMPLSVLASARTPTTSRSAPGRHAAQPGRDRTGIAGPLRCTDGNSGAPAGGPRTRRSAFLPTADLTIELRDLPEGRLPAVWGTVKEILEGVARILLA